MFQGNKNIWFTCGHLACSERKQRHGQAEEPLSPATQHCSALHPRDDGVVAVSVTVFQHFHGRGLLVDHPLFTEEATPILKHPVHFAERGGGGRS